MTPLFGWPSLLYATVFHDANKEIITGQRMLIGQNYPSSDHLNAVAVYDEHWIEELEPVNILRWSIIKQGGLALLTRDECKHHLGFQSVNVHADCCAVTIVLVVLYYNLAGQYSSKSCLCPRSRTQRRNQHRIKLLLAGRSNALKCSR